MPKETINNAICWGGNAQIKSHTFDNFEQMLISKYHPLILKGMSISTKNSESYGRVQFETTIIFKYPLTKRVSRITAHNPTKHPPNRKVKNLSLDASRGWVGRLQGFYKWSGLRFQ